jgi:hypothetical protein
MLEVSSGMTAFRVLKSTRLARLLKSIVRAINGRAFMENPNPLSKLALDYWYKVVMVVGDAVVLRSGGGVFSAFPVGATAAISAGGLLSVLEDR